MADLTQTLIEADALLRIARTAMQKMRLEGLGSDCRLSHEVRMFALEFSRESRDGPGVLQVNGTGRALKCLEAIRNALAQAEPVQEPFALPCPTPKACREHCCSGHCIPRATSPQQAEPLTPEWIWSWLMDWCKQNGTSPANYDSLFKMVSDARAIEQAHGIKEAK